MSSVSFPELKSSEEDLISFKDGWAKAQQCVDAYIDLLEEKFTQVETLKQLMALKVEHIQHFTTAYDVLFNMCIQRDPFNWSSNIYESSVRAIQNYVENKCVPAMENASSDHHFVWEWTKRWQMIKCFADAMNRIFMYLNRFYIPNSENDKVTAKENVYREYREKIYERYQKRVRKLVIASLSRIYSEHHPCDCPSPRSLVVVAAAPHKEQPPPPKRSSISTATAAAAAQASSSSSSSSTRSSLSRALSSRSKVMRVAKFRSSSSSSSSGCGGSSASSSSIGGGSGSASGSGSGSNKRASLPPTISTGGSSNSMSDATVLRMLHRSPRSRRSSAHQRVRVDEEEREDQIDPLPPSDAEALSTDTPTTSAPASALLPASTLTSASLTQLLSPSNAASSSSRLTSAEVEFIRAMIIGDEESDEGSMPPATKPPSSSSSREVPFFEEKLEFPGEPPAVPSSSVSSTSSISSCSSITSATSSTSSSSFRRAPKSRRHSSENDELMSAASSSSRATSTSKAASAAASRRRSESASPSATPVDLVTQYAQLVPNEKICPQDLCICAKVAFEELYEGRLFRRDFEPYECQLLLESQMRLIMQTTNLPAEALCGVIISFAFDLRGDPRQQHQSPSSNDSTDSNSSRRRGGRTRRHRNNGAPSPPPHVQQPTSSTSTVAGHTSVSPGDVDVDPQSTAATLAAAAAAAAAAEGHAHNAAGAAGGASGATPPPLSMQDPSSSDQMDTSVTPTSLSEHVYFQEIGAVRGIDVMREMIANGDSDLHGVRRLRRMWRDRPRNRRRMPNRDGASAASSSSRPSPSHVAVAKTLSSLRSGTRMSSPSTRDILESMPSLVDSSLAERSTSSFDYFDSEDEADEPARDIRLSAFREFGQRRAPNSLSSPQHRVPPSHHAMTPPPDLSRPYAMHSPPFPPCVDDEGEPFGLLWGHVGSTPPVDYPLLDAQSTPPPTPAPSSADRAISAEEETSHPAATNRDDPFELPLYIHHIASSSSSSSARSPTHSSSSSVPPSHSSSGVSPSLRGMSLAPEGAGGTTSSSPSSKSARFFRKPSGRRSMTPFFRTSSNPLSLSTASPTPTSSALSSLDAAPREMGLAHAAPPPPPPPSDDMLHSSPSTDATPVVSNGLSALEPLNILGDESSLSTTEISLAAPLAASSVSLGAEPPIAEMADSPSPPPASPPMTHRSSGSGVGSGSGGSSRARHTHPLLTTNSRARRADSMELKMDRGLVDEDDVTSLGSSSGDMPSFAASSSDTALSSASRYPSSTMSFLNPMPNLTGAHRRNNFGSSSHTCCPCPRVYTSSSASNVGSPSPNPTPALSSGNSERKAPPAPLVALASSPSTTTTSSSVSSRRRTAIDRVDDEDGANAADGRRVRSRLLSPSTAAASLADSTDAVGSADSDQRSHSDSSSDQDMSPPPTMRVGGSGRAARSPSSRAAADETSSRS